MSSIGDKRAVDKVSSSGSSIVAHFVSLDSSILKIFLVF
jgi:hypothetical protein